MTAKPMTAKPMTAKPMHSAWIAASGRTGGTGDRQAIFPYWSFSKTVMALVALRLHADGVWDIDAAQPGWPFTVRHLLAHTAGLPEYGRLPAYRAAVAAAEPPWPRDMLLSRAAADTLLFAPGDGWSYSNIGYLFVREAIEAATDRPFGDIVAEMVCQPLGLGSVKLAQTREDFAPIHWPAAARYDPGWVYHGCLIGTAVDAAALLQGIVTGALLPAWAWAEMTDARPLGTCLPGRPWTGYGYGLGVMRGTMDRVGTAVGHSGAGPFSVNAVYHFPDLSDPVTVACFTDGTEEGVAEHQAAECAKAAQ